MRLPLDVFSQAGIPGQQSTKEFSTKENYLKFLVREVNKNVSKQHLIYDNATGSSSIEKLTDKTIN